MPFDFYAELMKCKAKGSLYYVEAREEEAIIYALLTNIFGERDRKTLIDLYVAMWDKCHTMNEFWEIISKSFAPIILMQIMEEFNMDG